MNAKPIPKDCLVTGASGRLGHQLCRTLSAAGHSVTGLRLSHELELPAVQELTVDLTKSEDVNQAIGSVAPSVVIHAAGLTNVDLCEDHPEEARQLHVEATRNVAQAAARSGALLVYISTDHLWDGTQQLVSEDTPAKPINVYAKTKYEAEGVVAETNPKHLIIRTNFFGDGRPWRPSFSDWISDTLQAGKTLRMFQDAFFTPIESGLLCNIITELIEGDTQGLYHVAGGERISKYEFAVRLAGALDLPSDLIEPAMLDQAGLLAPRPHDMSLATNKIAALLGRSMPKCAESIANLKRHNRAPLPPQKRQLTYSRQLLDEDDKNAVLSVLESNFLTQGPTVERFEAAVAERVGAKFGVAVTSGTAALHVACLAAGVRLNDIAVAPTMSFVASANALRYCGAEICLIDCDGETLGVSTEGLVNALATSPSAHTIVTVDFGGLAAGSAEIRSLAEARVVIEDACHALGGNYSDGSQVGSGAYADMTVFSFHPVKPITTGEGGMITTNDPDLAHRMRLFRNHGIERSPDKFTEADTAEDGAFANPWYYEQQELGYNYRLSDIHAALGLSQLGKLDRFIDRRRAIAEQYDRSFADIPGITLYQQEPADRQRSAHHLYVIGLNYAALGMSRRGIFERLNDAGIRGQVHYIPIHRQPYYRDRFDVPPKIFPVAEAYYESCLTLPFYASLENEDVSRVIDAIHGIALGKAA